MEHTNAVPEMIGNTPINTGIGTAGNTGPHINAVPEMIGNTPINTGIETASNTGPHINAVPEMIGTHQIIQQLEWPLILDPTLTQYLK